MKDLEGSSFFSDMSGTERESSSQLKLMGMNSIGQAKQNSYNLSKEEEEERQRTLRHFFDEWPQRNKDPWMDLKRTAPILKLSSPSPSQNGHFSLFYCTVTSMIKQ